MIIFMDLYKRGVGIIQKFPSVNSIKEADEFIESYCKEHNITIIGKEYCGDSHWNYLSDGTEIDYCIDN